MVNICGIKAAKKNTQRNDKINIDKDDNEENDKMEHGNIKREKKGAEPDQKTAHSSIFIIMGGVLATSETKYNTKLSHRWKK